MEAMNLDADSEYSKAHKLVSNVDLVKQALSPERFYGTLWDEARKKFKAALDAKDATNDTALTAGSHKQNLKELRLVQAQLETAEARIREQVKEIAELVDTNEVQEEVIGVVKEALDAIAHKQPGFGGMPDVWCRKVAEKTLSTITKLRGKK